MFLKQIVYPDKYSTKIDITKVFLQSAQYTPFVHWVYSTSN